MTDRGEGAGLWTLKAAARVGKSGGASVIHKQARTHARTYTSSHEFTHAHTNEYPEEDTVYSLLLTRTMAPPSAFTSGAFVGGTRW